MQAVRDEVFAAWLQEVHAKVQRAQSLAVAVSINTMPVFYDHLTALISATESTYDYSTLATEHGGERARLTHLDAASVVHEYQLFRAVLFTVWAKHQILLSPGDAAVVN